MCFLSFHCYDPRQKHIIFLCYVEYAISMRGGVSVGLAGWPFIDSYSPVMASLIAESSQVPHKAPVSANHTRGYFGSPLPKIGAPRAPQALCLGRVGGLSRNLGQMAELAQGTRIAMESVYIRAATRFPFRRATVSAVQTLTLTKYRSPATKPTKSVTGDTPDAMENALAIFQL